jgi:diaminopimelate decarboxylase
MHTISSDILTDIAQSYGTPVWVYDASVIRQRIASLRAFDVIRYAQKACSNIHLLQLMRAAGVHVDAVSLGEIERAMRAGYTAHPNSAELVFTADLFDRATLERVIAAKITVNAGSIDMLEQLGKDSPGHHVWLRINPGFGHGHSHKTNTGGENSKHGIWHTQLNDAVKVIQKYHLNLIGLHMHIGSGVDYEHLERVCEAMVNCACALQIPFQAISAGGGLSIPYTENEQAVDIQHYFSLWDKARKRIEKNIGHALKLEIEPGRFLIAEAGALVSEVRAVKEMGNNHFVLIDAGFNDLMRPAMYGSYHHISLLSAHPSPALKPTIVAGPLCESGDVFTQNQQTYIEPRMLPDTQVGDYLVFHDTGAYGASMSSNYNSRPLIAEVLLDGTTHRLIRRRQTIADLLMLEEELTRKKNI